MSDKNLRKEFEAWFRGMFPQFPLAFRGDGSANYFNSEANVASITWKAAKASSQKDIEQLTAQRDFYEERWRSPFSFKPVAWKYRKTYWRDGLWKVSLDEPGSEPNLVVRPLYSLPF